MNTERRLRLERNAFALLAVFTLIYAALGWKGYRETLTVKRGLERLVADKLNHIVELETVITNMVRFDNMGGAE